MPITVPNETIKTLDEFEGKQESFNDYELHQALKNSFKPVDNTARDLRSGWWAELAAFEFRVASAGEVTEWGSHFGPMMSATYEDGTRIERPDIKEIDEDILNYWKLRAESSKHPVCKARYADLVWDLSPLILSRRDDVKFPKMAIDAYIETSDKVTSETRVQSIQNLERALELAISLNDKERISAVKNALFRLFDRIAQPGQDGTWPFLFDLLYDNKKVPSTEEEEGRIISSLEGILKKCGDPELKENFSPWGAQAAAERLEKHYKKKKQDDDISRVIRVYGNAFESLSAQASSLVAMSWLQGVYESYKQHGLKEDALRVQAQSKEKGKHAKDEMKTVVSEVKISSEDMTKLVDEFTKKDLTSALRAIPDNFIPRIDHITSSLEQQRKEHPLQALISVNTIAEDQIVAKTGSFDDDPHGRVRLELSQRISISTLFLSTVLEKIKAHYSPTAAQLTDYLYRSPLFDEDRRTLIFEGLEAYLNGDHVKFIHVTIPQMEHALRRLLSLLGQPTNKPTKLKGTMQEQNINDILANPAVHEVMPEDMRLYLLVILADPKGLNIRHRVSHGLMGKADFDRRISDLIFATLLCLGNFTVVEKPRSQDETLTRYETKCSKE